MILKNAFHAAIVLTLTTPALARAEGPATPAVDFAKVNTQIQSVIDRTFQADDVLEGISFQVNPKTADLDQLKLDVRLTASAKTSPWAMSDKTTVSLSAKTKAGKIRADGKVSLLLQAKAGFQTQVVKLIQFVSQKASARLEQPSDPAELPNHQRLVAVLSDLEKAGSLSDIYPALVELKKVLLDSSMGQERREIEKVEISSAVVDGKTQSIALRYRDTVEFFGLQFRNIGVTFDASKILGGIDVAGRVDAHQVEKAKREVREELLKIQDGEAEAMQELEDSVTGWAMMAKEMLQSAAE